MTEILLALVACVLGAVALRWWLGVQARRIDRAADRGPSGWGGCL